MSAPDVHALPDAIRHRRPCVQRLAVSVLLVPDGAEDSAPHQETPARARAAMGVKISAIIVLPPSGDALDAGARLGP